MKNFIQITDRITFDQVSSENGLFEIEKTGVGKYLISSKIVNKYLKQMKKETSKKPISQMTKDELVKELSSKQSKIRKFKSQASSIAASVECLIRENEQMSVQNSKLETVKEDYIESFKHSRATEKTRLEMDKTRLEMKLSKAKKNAAVTEIMVSSLTNLLTIAMELFKGETKTTPLNGCKIPTKSVVSDAFDKKQNSK